MGRANRSCHRVIQVSTVVISVLIFNLYTVIQMHSVSSSIISGILLIKIVKQ